MNTLLMLPIPKTVSPSTALPPVFVVDPQPCDTRTRSPYTSAAEPAVALLRANIWSRPAFTFVTSSSISGGSSAGRDGVGGGFGHGSSSPAP